MHCRTMTKRLIRSSRQRHGHRLTVSQCRRTVRYICRETLYHAGQEKGYTASEEEVQNIIDTELEWENGADGQEYFQAYLDELGMTAEEYWDSQRPLLAKEIVIGKYLDAEKEQSGLTDETEWQTYEKKLVQTLLEQDGITYTIQ